MKKDLRTTEEKFNRFLELLTEFLLGEMEIHVKETREEAMENIKKIDELISLVTDTSDPMLIEMIIDEMRKRSQILPMLEDLYLGGLPDPDFI